MASGAGRDRRARRPGIRAGETRFCADSAGRVAGAVSRGSPR